MANREFSSSDRIQPPSKVEASDQKLRSGGHVRRRVGLPPPVGMERWHQVMDCLPDPMAVVDASHCILEPNQAFADRLGLTKQQTIGEPYYECVFGVGEPPSSCPYAAFLADGNAHDATLFVERMGGEFSILVKSLPGSAGQDPASLHLFRELDEKLIANEILCLQRDLSIALANSTSLDESLRLCLDAALKVSGMDGGGVYLIDHAKGNVHLAHHCGLSDEFIRNVSRYASDSAVAQQVLAGRPLYTRLDQFGQNASHLAVREGLVAIGVIPILHRDTVIACLNVASRSLTSVPASCRSALESVAGHIGGAIDKIRTQEQLAESQRNLQTLFDSVSDFLLVIDLQGKLVQVNQVVLQRLGYSEEELLGRHVLQVHPPKCHDEAAGNFERILAGETDTCRVPLVTKAGEEISVETRVNRGRWGNADAIFGISRDVTERERLQDELKRKEEWLRTLIEESASTFAVMDEDGIINYASPSHRHVFGIDPQRIVGEHFIGRVHPKDQPQAFQDIGRLLKNPNMTTTAETRIKHADGSWRHVSVSCVNRLGNAAVRGIIVTSQDITERKRTQEMLRASEQKYRHLVETLTETVFSLDSEGQVTFVSPCVKSLVGCSPQEAIGKSFTCCIHAHDVARAECDFQAALSGDQQAGEYRLLKTSGDTCYVHTSFHRRMIDGEVVGIDGVAVDITARRIAENSLQASEARLRNAQRVAQLGFWDCNLDTGELYWSEEIYRMFGVTADSFDGTYDAFLNAVHPEDREFVNQVVDRSIRESSKYSLDHRIVRPDGEVRYVHEDGELADDGHGGPLRMLGTVIDITERKRAEEALRESREVQAEAEKLAATGRMAAQVAHEINNPLAGIKNSFRLIRDAVPEHHPDHDMVDRIEREIDRIAHIVRQMYKLHSPDKKMMADVAVSEVVQDTLLIVEPLGRQHAVKLNIEPISPKLVVRAHEGSLQQILYNLVTNAIRASHAEGEVVVSAELNERSTVKITVRDRGDGIPDEVMGQIFEPFFSFDPNSKRREGIGLGLSIVGNIVESLKGKIDVVSEPGVGTRFDVLLPGREC
jgi:PAS domain S-box-containing protein